MTFKGGSRGQLVALHIIFFILLLSTTTTFSLTDAEHLLRFKSTISDPHNLLQSWDPSTTPCNGHLSVWIGVFCDVGGNVAKLVLENMKLSGKLDTSPLVELRALKSISFMNNQFEGPMPNVGRFVWLRALYLSGNRLSGRIRGREFSRMLALSRVHLSRNSFVGPIPRSLVGVARLRELMLDQNGFQGRIPMFRQVGLRVNFSNNDLEGPIPVGFRNLYRSAFFGNKNLCGPPLDVACNATHLPDNPPKRSPLTIIILIISALIILIALLCICLICFGRRRDEECVGGACVRKKDRSTDAGCIEGGGKRKAMKENEHGKLVFVKEGSPTFELADLLTASAEVLGSGSFGSSYMALLMDGSSVVVKRFREMNAVGREDFSQHMRRLGRLSHPNLSPLVAFYYRKDEKLLITDYIPNGSLAHMLHGGSNDPKLDWPTRLKIIKGVARGMAYLHRELANLKLPHGHLKSSNVLLDGSFEPFLTDYGLTPVTNKSRVGHIMVAFKAPEFRQNAQPTKKADVWSLGVMILEVLTGKFPASFLIQGSDGENMTDWVNSILEAALDGEPVLDVHMGERSQYEESEMMKLLKVGRECCRVEVAKRLELVDAVKKIEAVREVDLVEEVLFMC